MCVYPPSHHQKNGHAWMNRRKCYIRKARMRWEMYQKEWMDGDFLLVEFLTRHYYFLYMLLLPSVFLFTFIVALQACHIELYIRKDTNVSYFHIMRPFSGCTLCLLRYFHGLMNQCSICPLLAASVASPTSIQANILHFGYHWSLQGIMKPILLD